MDYHLLNEYRNKRVVEHNIMKIKIISNVTTLALMMFLAIELAYKFITNENLIQLDWIPYAFIIGVNVCWHILCKSIEQQGANSNEKLQLVANAYIYAMLLAGAIVTLSNSVIFNNLMLYTLILLVCSSYFVLQKQQIILPMTIATIVILSGLYVSLGFGDQFIIKAVYIAVLNPIAYVTSRSYFTAFEKTTHTQVKLIREMEERKKVMRKLRDVNRKLEMQASIDSLTNIYNRHAVNEYMTQLSKQAEKSSFLLSTIMLDIDYFKQYNDTYGHLAGDEVLVQVGTVLQELSNEQHVFVARWGGEEFMVVLLNANEYKVQALCEAILDKVDKLTIEHRSSLVSDRITVSIGANSVIVKEPHQVIESLNYADSTLYDVKNNGRNGYAIRMAVV